MTGQTPDGQLMHDKGVAGSSPDGSLMHEKMNAHVRAGIAMIGPLRGYARALAGSADAANELVQQTLMQALAAQHQFVPGSALRAWLFTILRHIWLAGMRRHGRERRAMEGWQHPATTTASEEDGPAADRPADALRALPALQREALLLVSVSGLSSAQAAGVWAVPAGTLRARVSRARHAMKRALGPLPEEGASICDHP